MPTRETVVAAAPGAYSNRYRALEHERRTRAKQTALVAAKGGTPGRDRTKELRIESKKRREAFKKKEEERRLTEERERDKLLQARREKIQSSSKGFKRAVQVRQKKLAEQKKRQQEKELLEWARAATPPDIESVMAEVTGRASTIGEARSRHGSSSSSNSRSRPASRSGQHTPAMMDKVLEHERMLSDALSAVRGGDGDVRGAWGVKDDGAGAAQEPPSPARPRSTQHGGSRLPGPTTHNAQPQPQLQRPRPRQRSTVSSSGAPGRGGGGGGGGATHQNHHHPENSYSSSYQEAAYSSEEDGGGAGYRDVQRHEHQQHQQQHQEEEEGKGTDDDAYQQQQQQQQQQNDASHNNNQHHPHHSHHDDAYKHHSHPHPPKLQPQPPPHQAHYLGIGGRAGTSRPSWIRGTSQAEHPEQTTQRRQHQHQHQNHAQSLHEDDSSASGGNSSQLDNSDGDGDCDASADSLDDSRLVRGAAPPTNHHNHHNTANIDRPFPFQQQQQQQQQQRPVSNAFMRTQNHERRMSIGDLSGSDALQESASAAYDSMNSMDSMDSMDEEVHGSPPQSPYQQQQQQQQQQLSPPLQRSPPVPTVEHAPPSSSPQIPLRGSAATVQVRKRTIGGGRIATPKMNRGGGGGGASRLKQPTVPKPSRSQAQGRQHQAAAPRRAGVATAANIEHIMERSIAGGGGPRTSHSRNVGWTLDEPEEWGTPPFATRYQPKLAKTPTDEEINKLWAALRNGINNNRDAEEEHEEQEEQEEQEEHEAAKEARAVAVVQPSRTATGSAVPKHQQPPGTASSGGNGGGGSEPGSRLGTAAAAGRFNIKDTLARARAMTGSSRGSRKPTKAEKLRTEAEANEAKLMASLENLNTRLHITYGDGNPPPASAGAVADGANGSNPRSPSGSPSRSKSSAVSGSGKKKKAKAKKVVDGKVWDGKGGKALSAKEEQIIKARKAYSTKTPKKKPKDMMVDPAMLRSVNDTLSAMAAMQAANR